MIDNFLLEELVEFKKSGTLSKTADHLHVNQSSVTRGMQRLEEAFGTRLFIREPNRISLNQTGELAAKEAVKVIAQQKKMLDQVQNFARSQELVTITATIPLPLHMVRNAKIDFPENFRVTDNVIGDSTLKGALMNRDATLIFSNQNLLDNEINSQFIGTETLAVNLDRSMPLASHTTVAFADLANLSFIVMPGIGTWAQIIQQNIPTAKFLYQEKQDTFSEITKYSNFPYFSSNLSKYNPHYKDRIRDNDDREEIAISDNAAHMPIYLSYLKEQRDIVVPFIDVIRRLWPTL